MYESPLTDIGNVIELFNEDVMFFDLRAVIKKIIATHW